MLAASAITIRPTSIAELIERAGALLDAHHDETEPHFGRPEPRWSSYRQIESMGMLLAFGAFDGDEMVGYALAYVLPHMHYPWSYGNHDALFLRKDCRRGSLGGRLMRALSAAAKERGAACMFWHAKPGTPFEQLVARGAKVEETVYREDL